MNLSTKKSNLGRASAVGLSALIAGGLVLAGVAPTAAAADRYDVAGVVTVAEGAGFVPVPDVTVSITIPDPGYSDTVISDATGIDGGFLLPEVPLGTHEIEFTAEGFDPKSVTVEVVDENLDLSVTLTATPEPVAAGTVTIAGTPLVGNTLTAQVAGWPSEATLTYEWFYSGGQFGGEISGATAASYTVTSDRIGNWLGVIVTGSMAGHSDSSVRYIMDAVVFTPKKAPAPAPADLDKYLADNASTPQAPAAAGLPAGPIDPGVGRTAELNWSSPDSFVDVYVFSSPIFIGTFPVVNGVVQFSLSPAIMGQLAAGGHTLVITGQSSGAVQSVALSIGLAATGADVTVPLVAGSLLLTLGAGMIAVRRRYSRA